MEHCHREQKCKSVELLQIIKQLFLHGPPPPPLGVSYTAKIIASAKILFNLEIVNLLILIIEKEKRKERKLPERLKFPD